MKSYLHILLLSSLFASCTSAYKSGQTPDDVYFSPARPDDEYVRVDEEEERYRRDEEAYRDDRYLRMKVRNKRYATLEDDYYAYGNYGNYYGYYPYLYNTPFHSVSYWNYYYNPYCSGNVIISNPKSTVYSRPRTFNMGVFTSPSGAGTNIKSTRPQTRYGYTGSSNGNSNYKSSGRNAGSYLRDIFSSSGNTRSNESGNTSTRSSSSSGSSGSTSPSSSSGGRGNASLRKN